MKALAVKMSGRFGKSAKNEGRKSGVITKPKPKSLDYLILQR